MCVVWLVCVNRIICRFLFARVGDSIGLSCFIDLDHLFKTFQRFFVGIPTRSVRILDVGTDKSF